MESPLTADSVFLLLRWHQHLRLRGLRTVHAEVLYELLIPSSLGESKPKRPQNESKAVEAIGDEKTYDQQVGLEVSRRSRKEL